MLGFCHLFAGAVFGTLIYKKTGQRTAVPACCIGALIPDLIDKPLGHWLLSESLNSGRIYAHTMLFTVAILCIGIYYWKRKHSIAFLSVGGGSAIHMALDEIWQAPVTLFWPFMGPFTSTDFESYFTTFAIYEITSPSEWMFVFAVIYVFALNYQDKKMFAKLYGLIKKTGMLPQVLLFTAGIAYAAYAAYTGDYEYLIIGLTAALGGIVLVYAAGGKISDLFTKIISRPPNDCQ